MEVDASTSRWSGPKSEEELRLELKELQQEHSLINERLRSNSFRRPARTSSGGRQQVPFVEKPVTFRRSGFEKRPELQAFLGQDITAREEPPIKKKKLLSAVVKAVAEEEGQERHDHGAGEIVENITVIEERRPQHDEHEWRPPPENVPRVLPVEKDANVLKRNRRMFGSLLMGTLQKFKEEDKKLQSSAAFVRRNTQLIRAEQKKKEESERLWQKSKVDAQEKRRNDLMLRARIEAKTEEKLLEIRFLKWQSHHTQLAMFPRTKAHPPLFFLPALHYHEVDAIVEQQKQELDVWEVDRKLELKAFCKGILEEKLASAENEFTHGPRFKSKVVLAAQEVEDDLSGYKKKEEKKDEDAGITEDIVDAREFEVHDAIEFREEEKAEDGAEKGTDNGPAEVGDEMLAESGVKPEGSVPEQDQAIAE